MDSASLGGSRLFLAENPAPSRAYVIAGKSLAGALVELGTAGKRTCPLITPQRIGLLVLAATLAHFLPQAADARGSHGAGIGGRTGVPTSRLLATPLATQAPGTPAHKQAASPQTTPAQSSTAAANASLAAAAAAP